MRGLFGAITAFAVMLIAASAQAAVAQYRTSFGTNGSTIIRRDSIGEDTFTLLHETGGRIFIGGESFPQDGSEAGLIAALTPTGQVDSSFANGGLLTSTSYLNVQALVAATGGNLIAAGDAGPQVGGFRVTRFSSAGAVNLAFANADFGDWIDSPLATKFQSDGKLVVVGKGRNSLTNDDGDFAIARFTTAGALDTSFNATGKRTENFFVAGTESSSDGAAAVAIQPDGKVLVGGWGGNLTAPPDNWDAGFHILRYNSDGSRDTNFGQVGLVVTHFADPHSTPMIDNLNLLSDGKILASGHDAYGHFLMAKYNSDGQLVQAFGQQGTVSIPDLFAYHPHVEIGSDGLIRMVAAGDLLYDALFDSDGHLLQWTARDFPGATIPGYPYLEYTHALIMENGDILAAGRAATTDDTIIDGWIYNTDLLISRFQRGTAVPEPAAAFVILLLGAIAIPRRRLRDSLP